MNADAARAAVGISAASFILPGLPCGDLGRLGYRVCALSY